LLAAAGPLPEPEGEERMRPPARGQPSRELGGASELGGRERSAQTPFWRVRANIDGHATGRPCVSAQRSLSELGGATGARGLVPSDVRRRAVLGRSGSASRGLPGDERGERRTRMDVELLEDPAEVVPDGLLAEEQRRGDFAIRLA